MKRRIAIVLAESDLRLSLEMARVLEAGKYEVISVRSAGDCLEAIRESRPDLVLLSAVLPDTDGLNVVRTIRSDAAALNTLVLLTAPGDVPSDIQAEGLEAGADGFIPLPVSPRELLARVGALIRIRQREEALHEPRAGARGNGKDGAAVRPAETMARLDRKPEEHVRTRGGADTLQRELNGQARECAEELLASEEALEESKTMFDAFALLSPVGIFRTNARGECIYVNRKWCEMTGMSPVKALGGAWVSAIHPRERCHIAADWSENAPADKPFNFECRFRTQGGREIYVLGQSMPETDAEGTVIGHIGTVTDITDLKHTEDALRESEERYRFLAENSGDVLYRLKYDSMYYDYLSPSIEKVTGYRPEEICVLGFSHLVTRIEVPGTGAVSPDVLAMNRRAGQVGEFQADYLIHTKDGEFRWLRDHSFPWKDASGKVVGSLGILSEVTERKEAEERLRENEERFRRFAEEASFEGIVIHDGGIILDVNEAYAAMHGYGRAELMGSLLYSALAPDSCDFVREKAETRYAGSYETMAMKKDGTIFPVEVHARDISFQGKLVRAAAVRDLTERKRAEEEIKEREEFLKAIVENIPAVMLVKDARDLRILRVNKGAEDLFGCSRDEMVGRVAHDLFEKDLADSFVRNDRSALEKGEPSEIPEDAIRFKHSGERIWHTKNIPIFDNQGNSQYLLSLSQDITERKRGEKALEESEKRYRLLFNSIDDALFVHEGPRDGLPGRFMEVNDTACRRLGYTKEELLQMSPPDIDTPETVAALPPIMEKLMREGQTAWEGMHVTREGRRIPVEIVNHLFQLDGKSLILSSARDISERRKAEREREKLEAQLRQSQKMEAIGTLAGGIAHDFNNILAAIIGYAEIVAAHVPPSSSMHNGLQNLLKAAFRARDLVKQILVFSRMKSTGERAELNLAAVTGEVVGFLRATLPSTVEIREDIGAPNGNVLANQTQIHQVLMNLATNAAHAMPDGGVLTVALDEVTFDSVTEAFTANITPGVYLRLTVSDTGHGMDAATVERIFDPYFTTKEVGKGSGLGLSVVQGIVKRHEGAIDVRSVPGEGTVFRVYLPAVALKTDPPAVEEAPFAGGTERILLVDDERAVVEVTRQILEMLGYRVTTRMNGAEALQAFLAAPGQFDLVITDFTMPRMTGLELAGEILAVRSRLPVILCTGFSERVSEEKAASAGIRALVLKPLKMQEFARLIRSVLDSSGP